MSIRDAVGDVLLAGLTPLLNRSRPPLPRLLADAISVKRRHGRGAEALKDHIEAAFRELAELRLDELLAFDRHRASLSACAGHKCALHGRLWGDAAGGLSFRLASRLANRRGITFDILRLAEGTAIPPHAHCGVVSGMLVIEGDAGVRTYDVDDAAASDAAVRVHPRQAERLGRGGVSTSSATRGNLHWIHAYSSEVFLLRFTVTNIDGEFRESEGRVKARIYLLPDDKSDPQGHVLARRADEAAAMRYPFSLPA